MQLSGSIDISPGGGIKERKFTGKTDKNKASKADPNDAKGVSFQDEPDVENQKKKDIDKDPTSGILSGRNWESYLMDDHKYNSALKILESATLSGSGSGLDMGMASRRSFMSEIIPLWMRFDEHSRLRREFQNEMRMLSR